MDPELVATPGTPKELALEAVAEQCGIKPETLRYRVYSARDCRYEIDRQDRCTKRPDPPFDWDGVRRVIGTRRRRLTKAMRSALATGLRADPDPPDDIVELVSGLLAKR